MKQNQNGKKLLISRLSLYFLMLLLSAFLFNSCKNKSKESNYLATAESRIKAIDTILADSTYRKEYLDSKGDNTEILYAMNFEASQVWAIFRDPTVTYVEFTWVKDQYNVTLNAVGKNSAGRQRTTSTLTRVPMSSPNTFNFPRNSSLYYKRGQIKALMGLSTGTSDVITEAQCKDVLLLPHTTSDASRNYNLYYTGSGSNILRDANPMPPFTAPCVNNCDSDNE